MLPAIFEKIGPYVRDFEFSGGFIMEESIKESLIDGLAHQCPQITKLSLMYTLFSRDQIERLSRCLRNLTYLRLERCNLEEQTVADVFREDLKSLKTLNISGNTMLTGSCLANLKQLQVLDASYCFDLSHIEFVKFLKNCSFLKSLDISACVKLLNGSVVEEIHTFQPKIEELYFLYAGQSRDSLVYSRFKHLRVLDVQGNNYLL